MAITDRLDLKLSSTYKQLLQQAAAIEAISASSVSEEQLLDPKRHVHQNMPKGISQAWALVPLDQPSTIAGYYSLAPAEVVVANLQPADARPLPPLSHPLISDRLSSASPPLAWKRAGRVAHRPCGRTLSAGSPVRGRQRAERGCKWRRGQMLLLRCLRPNDRSSAVAGPPPAVREQQRVRKQSRC